MTKVYSKYEHTAVIVDHPDRPDGWDGSFDIVLHTGTHVWVNGSYSLQGHASILQVGIGGPSPTAYDEDGNCILAVPSEWCHYLTPEDAEDFEHIKYAEEIFYGRIA